ncbi:MAG: Ig-like domain-containing protein [Verrucomicrobia bacterium]|nr:Ig-like domain-containing protein [Verrucomicrobiota bacterium]
MAPFTSAIRDSTVPESIGNDLVLTELDATGASMSRPTPSVTLAAPANQTFLPIGQTVNIVGSFANIDSVSSVVIRSGNLVIGTAQVSGNTFSYAWTPTQAGNYALYANALAGDGSSSASNVIRVKTGYGLSGLNQRLPLRCWYRKEIPLVSSTLPYPSVATLWILMVR